MSETAETDGLVDSVTSDIAPVVEEEKSDHNIESRSESSAAREISQSLTEAKQSTHAPGATDEQEHISKVDEHTRLRLVIWAVRWGIVITFVLVYFGYLMNYYLDDDRNVKQYAVSKNVQEMPAPFIYIEFYSNGGNCWASRLYDDDNVSHLSNTSISTKTLVEEYAESSWVSIAKENDLISGWIQMLLVPPKDKTLVVESKNYIGVDVDCDHGNTTEVWLLIGHTAELMEHTTVLQALDVFYYDCDRLFSGYEVRVTYEWYGFRNKLKDETEKSDYFASTIESTFAMLDYPDIQSSIKISPNPNGRRTIFVTSEEISFWSVLSLVGGMLSATSFLGVVTVYVLWGYSLPLKCGMAKFGGLAPEAELGHVKETQLKNFVKREVCPKIDDLNQEIKKLQLLIAHNKNKGQ